jgi:hypothetical protein
MRLTSFYMRINIDLYLEQNEVMTTTTTTGALLLSSTIQLQPAMAQSDDNRPRAPLSALLPATQKRLLMERAFNLSKNLMALDAARDDERTNKIVQELKTMVKEPDFDNPGFGKAAIVEKRLSERQLFY